ncbi:MAG: hypothetical protein II794_08860 [Oscillospiraceae bacterium]|nr:hypothetical protein [Oscillospiraceae bacterium]
MSTRGTNIVAYITWIGWIIAFLVGDRENCKFHLNQALVLNIASLLAIIPVIGWILAIVVFIGWIIGIMGAVRGQENKVPVLGDLQLLK